MNRSYPALRGVAILLVVLNHSIYMVTDYASKAAAAGRPGLSAESLLFKALSAVSGLGVLAVPIFLFLSGCFFAYAGGRKDLRADYKIVWSNIKHVGVPYLIWSLIFYAEIFLVHGERPTALGLVKNLLVGYPFNFVPLLIFYYAVSPLLIRAMHRFGVWPLLAIGVYQVLLLAVVSPRLAGFALPGFMRLAAVPVLTVPLAEWGVFFPLGLYIVHNGGWTAEKARRYSPALILALLVFFALTALSSLRILQVPLVRQLAPLPFLLLTSAFQRSAFPAVRTFELLGKRAYGVYLTNLLVLDLSLFALQALFPGVFAYVVLLLPLMFAVGLLLPLLLMAAFERRMRPVVFHYAFG